MPLDTANDAQIQQPAFTKLELAGRPLRGTYAMGIRERPGFVWRNLEDVLILVFYGYCSRFLKITGG